MYNVHFSLLGLKLLPPGVIISELKNVPNSISAGALPQTPLGELTGTALPQTPSSI